MACNLVFLSLHNFKQKKSLLTAVEFTSLIVAVFMLLNLR